MWKWLQRLARRASHHAQTSTLRRGQESCVSPRAGAGGVSDTQIRRVGEPRRETAVAPDPIAALLARAAKAPVDETIHQQLDEMVPPCPRQIREARVDLKAGMGALADLFEHMGGSALVSIAYALPEIGRFDVDLLTCAPKRGLGRQSDGSSWLTIAERLESLVHMPSYEPQGFEWQRPVLELHDGVLEVEQSSTCRYYEGGRSHQTNRWILYRVKGRLVHVRSMSSYRSSG